MDLHAGRAGGLGRHHLAGAHAVRRARAHRRAPLRDRVRHRQAAPAAAALSPANLSAALALRIVVNKIILYK